MLISCQIKFEDFRKVQAARAESCEQDCIFLSPSMIISLNQVKKSHLGTGVIAQKKDICFAHCGPPKKEKKDNFMLADNKGQLTIPASQNMVHLSYLDF